MDNHLLSGRIAIVTGAARGLGRAYALALARWGADVVVSDYNLQGARRVNETLSEASVAEEIRALGRRSLEHQGDLTRAADADALFDSVLAEFGRVDILVNNAGGIRSMATLCDMDEAAWIGGLNQNLHSVFLCCRRAGQIMRKQRSGSIINVSSVSATTPLYVWMPHYNTAKAAVSGLTRTFALEMAPYGVRVNAIAPGHIETSAWAQRFAPIESDLAAQVPLGRVGQPEDCASVVAFLASDLSAYITGQVLRVDGGMDLNPVVGAEVMRRVADV